VLWGRHTDGGLTVALGCDGMRSLVWSGMVGTDPCGEQVGEVLEMVGEVTLTGSKHGRLNGT